MNIHMLECITNIMGYNDSCMQNLDSSPGIKITVDIASDLHIVAVDRMKK